MLSSPLESLFFVSFLKFSLLSLFFFLDRKSLHLAILFYLGCSVIILDSYWCDENL